MTADAWKKKIRKQVCDLGLYRSQFSSAVDALAKILEQRDAVYRQFVAEGQRAVVEKKSDRGAVNTAKNPLLVLWMELNSQALAYWVQLGLTPAGLRKINEEAMKKPKRSALAEALAALER